MSIVLSRVDFRLVHAQVMHNWVKQLNVNIIEIADDELLKDTFMMEVFKSSAPKDTKLDFLSVEKAIDRHVKNEYVDNKNYLLLFRNIKNAHKAIESGLNIDKLQIGGVPGGPGKKVVSNAIAINDEEYNKLKEIHDKGVEIYFQTVPGYAPESYEQVMSKY